MKTSLQWLSRYLDPGPDRSIDADAFEQVLTRQGLPVEAREQLGTDVVFEVEVTSNRSDCLCHLGMARELAAGTDTPLAPPPFEPQATGGDDVHALSDVTGECPQLCPVYTARVIRDVRIGPSPDWLVRDLAAVGLRSVNNVVDVTNFVLFELGQPLHAFDLGRLRGRRIVVRRAREGEPFIAIDGTRHVLDQRMLVIADADVPVAVAGVMGGLDSEVGAGTTDLLLESAQFDPVSVRRTSRTLKLASDSSYRFERGVDPQGVDRASRRAARLILETAGGTLAPGVIRVGPDAPGPRPVPMRVARCAQLLGMDIPAARMVTLLGRLGLAPAHDEGAGTILCSVPTFRLDLNREVDLIEEVARMGGLDEAPVRPRIEIVARPAPQAVAARQCVGRVLVAHGYHETITFSFVGEQAGGAMLADGTEPIVLDAALRHGGTRAEPMLRPSLLPSLLACRKRNQDVGNTDVALFECARTWTTRAADPQEQARLGMLLDAPEPQQGLRSMRGTVAELAQALGARTHLSMSAGSAPWCRRGLLVTRGGDPVGAIGVADGPLCARFDLQTPVCLAELDLDALMRDYPPAPDVAALARFPGIARDLSVVVAEPVAWEDIASAVTALDLELLEELQFIVTYRGRPIPKGRKSVSFRMKFRDPERTLRHDQVDPQVDAVIACLQSRMDAEVRG